jgi:hypothetical protein
LYFIIAVISGNIYASLIGWPALSECEQNLRPSIEYLLTKTKDANIEIRCVDTESAGHFIVKSSTPFILFTVEDIPPSIVR